MSPNFNLHRHQVLVIIVETIKHKQTDCSIIKRCFLQTYQERYVTVKQQKITRNKLLYGLQIRWSGVGGTHFDSRTHYYQVNVNWTYNF